MQAGNRKQIRPCKVFAEGDLQRHMEMPGEKIKKKKKPPSSMKPAGHRDCKGKPGRGLWEEKGRKKGGKREEKGRKKGGKREEKGRKVTDKRHSTD